MVEESVGETFTQADIDAAYDSGYNDGNEAGNDSSYDNGYSDGKSTGYDEGNEEGHREEFDSMKMIITDLLTKRKTGSYVSVADIELLDSLIEEVDKIEHE